MAYPTEIDNLVSVSALDSLAAAGHAARHNELKTAFDSVKTYLTTKAPVASPTFTGVAAFPLGSAALPSIVPTGDTNTGIWSPAADTLAVSTAGVERLRVYSNGNVGIDTQTTPGARLHAAGTAANAPTLGTAVGVLALSGADEAYGLQVGVSAATGATWFQSQRTDGTATAYDIVLNPAGGNVGIGTSSPTTYGLTVAKATTVSGGLRVTSGTTHGEFVINDAAGLYVSNASATLPTMFWQGGTERMRIAPAGLITGTGTSLGAWTAYTPTLGGTGWAIGNGTVSGRYCQIGKIVYFGATVTLGSTSTAGGSGLTLSLPVTGNGTQYNGNLTGTIFDTSAGGRYSLSNIWQSTTTIQPLTVASPMTSLTTSSPFVWANADIIDFSGTYEAA